MQEKKSIFQVVVIGVFAFFIVVAVFIFAGLGGDNTNTNIGTVTLWGTFDQDEFDTYLRALNDIDSMAGNIVYEQHNPSTFHAELVEALANGTGPDVFVLEQSHLLRHFNKIQVFPAERFYDQRTFKDTFIDESELFISSSGAVRALPLAIDPLVLYWNRDMFAENGFAKAPEYWDEFFTLAQKITERDSANTIERAAVALGEYDNINYAKDIIAMLIMQAGGSITALSPSGDLSVTLGAYGFEAAQIPPEQSALRFYTEFANPIKNVYSWNRSMPYSRDAFAQGILALYIGRASDLDIIQAKNANLNFDVAPMPQIKSGEQIRTLTFGTVYALAVPAVAQNAGGGMAVAEFLTSKKGSALFSETIGVPSARRDVLSNTPSDPLSLIFRNAALIARGWLDPHAEETDAIFRRMINDVISGTLRLSDTTSRAYRELNELVD